MSISIGKLRRIVRLHISWLTYVLLGKELLSKEDLAELKKYGKLSLGDEISFVEKAFALGRASATMTQADYGELTLDALSRFEKMKYSTAEKLAIREAKLHSERYIHSIAEEVVAASSEAVNEASSKLINDVLQKMSDELTTAVIEKKTAKQLASRLSSIFNNGFKKDWTKFATTELHRAKIRGTAMAIANNVEVYKRADGVASNVSIVPNTGACRDCLELYLDEKGNPKIFKLSEMLKLGTNQDAKHTRNKDGIHHHWKAVLPPAHPNCYCSLVYVPPGMTWKNQKLKVSDSARYKEHLSKAVDQGSMSATIKPPGPKSSQGPNIPKTRSVPGLPAPGNTPGPGSGNTPTAALPKPSQNAPSAGPREGMVDCPFGGAKGCIQHGGDGADTHKVGGSIMQAHAEYQGNRASQADKDPQLIEAQIMAARDWNIEEHSHEVAMNHLEQGEIVSSKPLGDKEGFNTSAQRIFIAGNGSAIMKPPSSAYIKDSHNEVASYKLFSFMGSSACPMTGLRVHEGKAASSQAWLTNHKEAADVYKEAVKRKYTNRGDLVKVLLEKSKDPEALRKNLEEVSVMDMVMCNMDRHFHNMMIDEDVTEAKAIDHGFVFGRGYDRYRNDFHEGFNSLNMKTKITPQMNERFNNTTFTDLKKAIGGEVSEREIAQTYLRMRYVQQVQEEHGHLPYSEFESVDTLSHGYHTAARETGNGKFEDFVIDFIDKHSKNPSSPEYSAAFVMRDLGVLLNPKSHLVSTPDKEVRTGLNYAYEKKVRLMKAAYESKKRGEGDFLQPLLNEAGNKVYRRYKTQVEASAKKLADASSLVNSASKEYVQASMHLRDVLIGRVPGDEGEAESIKDLAFAVKEKANEQLKDIQGKYDFLMVKVNGETSKAHDDVYATTVPPGQEAEFRRLNKAIERAQSTYASKVREPLPKDYSKIRPQSSAAQREAAKREGLKQ